MEGYCKRCKETGRGCNAEAGNTGAVSGGANSDCDSSTNTVTDGYTISGAGVGNWKDKWNEGSISAIF